MTSPVIASVIVCTRNRSTSLSETLEALAALDTPGVEILIVDSSDGQEQQNTEAMARKFGAKYVVESLRGLSRARNTGIAAATGKIIAFTDDDCVPEKSWLTETLKNYSDPSVWACTGRVIQKLTGGASGLFEEVAGQDLGQERRVFTPADVQGGLGFVLANVRKVFAKHMKSGAPAPFGIGHGSSLSFRKKVFDTLGGFDIRFGGGAPFKGCDDIEMLYRVLKGGHKIVYEPAAVIYHKHRLTSDDTGSSAARLSQESTIEEVFKTRYIYSFSNGAMLREFRSHPPMFLMFYGRLLQLLLKSLQYRLTGNQNLAKSFGADLRGFLDGCKMHKKLSRENPAAHQPVG
jgi:GT2 family glycosyltransferase